ncbi:HNH endonuclease [Deinococcus saxicola]|uniref:HNH endonuclease n=1 Tax=Deinococcus saxicola TaxID=249406 RepID=UPI0039F1445F
MANSILVTEGGRSCRVCHQTKLLKLFPKNRPDGSWFFRCLDCQATAYKTRYHQDDRRRALQIAYSMNGSVERRFPDLERLPPEQLVEIMMTTETCRYCGFLNGNLERGFQLDHVIPLSKGGPHELSNIALCCDRCNRAKWDSTEAEYLDWLREAAARLTTVSKS